MKLILGNHWTTAPEGWTVLKEEDQDITKQLQWSDNSIEAIMTEHTAEHVTFNEFIGFAKEVYRVLKSGGILRTTAPFIDQMVKFPRPTMTDPHGLLRANYTRTSLKPYYPEEAKLLDSMGIDFSQHGLPFFFDSLLKKHNHKFVWSSDLMVQVLKAVGFSDVMVCVPGDTEFAESRATGAHLLERVVRGIEPMDGVDKYDCESLVVEARK